MTNGEMDRETFNDAMLWLQKYYNFNLSPERLEKYWKDFRNVDEFVFARVVANDIPEKLRAFPTPEEIRRLIGEVEYNRQKSVDKPVNPISGPKPKASDKMRDGIHALAEFMSASPTAISRGKYIDELKKAGWPQLANEIAEEFAAKGKPVLEPEPEPVFIGPPEPEKEPEFFIP